jgi:hypothetical protein
LQANKPGITFRLVQPDELAGHAEKSATKKYGAESSITRTRRRLRKDHILLLTLTLMLCNFTLIISKIRTATLCHRLCWLTLRLKPMELRLPLVNKDNNGSNTKAQSAPGSPGNLDH